MKTGKQYVTRAGRQWGISRTRLVYRCTVDAGVSEKTARGVLFLDWPITSNARERAYRWGIKNRIEVQQAKDGKLVTAEPEPMPREDGPSLKPLRVALEGLVEDEAKRVTSGGATDDPLLAIQAERERRKLSDEASRAFDAISDELRKRESQ